MLSYPVVRRAVDAAADQLSKVNLLDLQTANFVHAVPWWGVAILGGTIAVFLLVSASIDYTIRLLIVNLAAVESPASKAVKLYSLISEDDAPDTPFDKKAGEQDVVDVDVETTQALEKPVTSNIRKTVRHITSIGGFTARWRGYAVYIFYCVAVALISSVFHVLPFFRGVLASIFGHLVAALAVAPLHCAWTHKTIAMPTGRILPELRINRAQHLHLLLPTALNVLAVDVTYGMSVLVEMLSFNKLDHIAKSENPNKALGALLAFAPLAVMIVGSFLAILPSYIILVRVEASLLPEDQDTIVPMDRTFGSSLADVTDKLSVKAAWNSFNGIGRIVKLYAKLFLIAMVLTLIFVSVFFFELWVFTGQNFPLLILGLNTRLNAEAMQISP